MALDLAGRTALVTGGFRGIGAQIAAELAAAGAATMSCGLHVPTESRGPSLPVRTDVTSAAELDALGRTIRDRFGSLDIVVCNAGRSEFTPLERLSPGHWDDVVGLNLDGAFHTVRGLLSLLNPSASIVLIGSQLATTGLPATPHYGAAKAALTGFARSLCRELGDRAIRVNVVAPGAVDTDATADMPEPVRRNLIANIPLGRLAKPVDVARLVVFLACRRSGFINGEVITVDGGV